jgi:predicted Zn-dependent peptidase
VKAAALDAGGPNVAVAVFVGAGSANETPETAGASKLLEYMAFSATSNRCGQARAGAGGASVTVASPQGGRCERAAGRQQAAGVHMAFSAMREGCGIGARFFT